MECIHVNTSSEYDVLIGQGLLSQSGRLIEKSLGLSKAALICTQRISDMYGAAVLSSLTRAGFEAHRFTVPSGEENKSLETCANILTFLAERRFTRGDVLIALGGGITGDMVGFAASVYRRGMRCVQMPTTLLSAVDSCVGGKTSVNLPEGKNLVGSFYQPSLVICDTNCFKTLPESVYRDGFAEIIKYGMILSPELFSILLDSGTDLNIEDIIARCVALKRDIVVQDEHDEGIRQILNFGHSFAHAVEKCSGYTVSHGSAVAIGMSIVSRAAANLGYCSDDTATALISLIEQYGLPTQTRISADELYAAMLSDKKLYKSTMTLIVPSEIGKVTRLKLSEDELMQWLKAGGIQ